MGPKRPESIGRDAAVVIVDVFSFGTAVTVAVERGASVYPWPGAAAADFARRENAMLCTDRSRTTFSLSRSRCSTSRTARASCCRRSTARASSPRRRASPARRSSRRCASPGRGAMARRMARPDRRRRRRRALAPRHDALRDRGLARRRRVVASLGGDQSSEARLAAAAFEASRTQLARLLSDSVSGRELVSRGFAGHVALAGDCDARAVVPVAGPDGWLIDI